MKQTVRAAVLTGIAVLALTSCRSSSDSAEHPSSAAPTLSPSVPSGSVAPPTATAALKACLVLDTGGLDDLGFNAFASAGLTAANKADPSVEVSDAQPTAAKDYPASLARQKAQGCNVIIADGAAVGDAVTVAAAKNPAQQYAVVNAASSGPNVYGLRFNLAQGAFLAGYLAAAETRTGKVATYGAVDIPSITSAMDGFWQGVQYYNLKRHKSVGVLGWDEALPTAGTFVGNFTSQAKARQITATFKTQFADVVFPVAGRAGLGSAALATAGGLQVIWSGSDGCFTAPTYCPVFLTSVTTNLSGALTTYVASLAAGAKLGGKNSVGTLANGGVGLAPFHVFDAKIPDALKDELDSVKADIVSGAITLASPIRR